MTEYAETPGQEHDTLILKAILACDVGTIANIVQAAAEIPWRGDMRNRLVTAYYELTNKDPGVDKDMFRLREDDDDDNH